MYTCVDNIALKMMIHRYWCRDAMSRPLLGAYGIWAEREFYHRGTPAVTRGLGILVSSDGQAQSNFLNPHLYAKDE